MITIQLNNQAEMITLLNAMFAASPMPRTATFVPDSCIEPIDNASIDALNCVVYILCCHFNQYDHATTIASYDRLVANPNRKLIDYSEF